MHSFLKAEWKTIVGMILFCGAIFGWFYHDEIVKSQQKNAEYAMKCMVPGQSFRQYQLNTPASALNLDGFVKSTDDVLHIDSYKSQDGTTILNIRDGKLTSIEYYFPTDDEEEDCHADVKYWTSRNSQVAEPLTENKRSHLIYEGLILIRDTVESPASEDENASDSSKETEEDGEPKMINKMTGVMILNA